MRPHSLHRVITSRNLGNDSIVIVRIKPSPVAHLPASLGIKRSVIQNDFTLLARPKLPRPLPILNNGKNLAPLRPSLPIPLKLRLRQRLISRIRRLLRPTLPRSARAGFLLLHRPIKSVLIKLNALIASRAPHEIKRHPKRVVQLESFLAGEQRNG